MPDAYRFTGLAGGYDMVKPGIPAAEYLGICLIFAEYDLDMSMLEIVERVEAFEEAYDLEYGTWQYDFRGACYHIIWSDFWDDHRRLEESLGGKAEHEEYLRRATLRDWVKPILQRDHLWCNDEGCSWGRYPEDGDWPEEKKRLVEWKDANGEIQDRFVRSLLIDRFLIKSSMRFNKRIRELFSQGFPERQDIARFFARSHYARCVPYYWSSRFSII
jgi:hypothetical protein